MRPKADVHFCTTAHADEESRCPCLRTLQTMTTTWKSWQTAVRALLTGGGGVVPIAKLESSEQQRRDDVLRGQTVLVTGASSGIGRAIAFDVADAGATAILVARSRDKLEDLKTEISETGGRAFVYSADLSSPESTQALLDALVADGHRVDVLINNAGRSIRRSIDDSYDRVHDFERTMAINYFGSLRLILGLLPGMRDRKRGHIINISSAGVQMGTPLFSAYIASKAALDAFTRVAGSETHDGGGIRFTTIHMPLVRTPMIEPTPEYRSLPALLPEEASDIVLRALVTGEVQLGTRLGRIISLGHAVAPAAIERLMNFGHRMLGQ
jgi:NAD(P)-dependent dehydrogenase (short-subunit alcohol dehydrogenase family)